MTELKLDADQEAMVEFCMKHKRTYLAQPMGFGKTAVAIETYKRVRALTGQKLFVLCPIRVAWHVWPKELTKWAPELTFAIVHGPHKKYALESGADVLIMNYDGILWLAKQKTAWQPRMCILDEAAKLKYHNTERFERISKAHHLWTEYMIAMSGTPASAGLQGLWSQYYLLDFGFRLGINISEFRSRYCEAIQRPGLPITLYKVIKDREHLIHKQIADMTYSVDMTGKDTRPPVKHTAVELDMPKTLREQYKQLEKHFILELAEGTVVASNLMAKSSKLRQLTQGALYIPSPTAVKGKADPNRKVSYVHSIKAEALKEIIELMQEEPVIAAIQFRFDIDIITKTFGRALPLIAGGTSEADTTVLLARWDQRKIPLLLVHPASVSDGLNMQEGGHNLIYYGITTSLEQYDQLIGRLRRRGQEASCVYVQHLVIKDTIDYHIVEALNNHCKTQEDLLKYLQRIYH